MLIYRMQDYKEGIKGLDDVYKKDGLRGVQMYCAVAFIPNAVAYTYLLKVNNDVNMRKCLEDVLDFYKCKVTN